MAAVTFPLFRLPYVALAVVLDYINPKLIFRLSLISKKSHRVARSLRKKPEKIILTFGNKDGISIAVGGRSYILFIMPDYLRLQQDESVFESLRIKNTGANITMKKETDKMYIHCNNDSYSVLETLCDYVINFYGQPIHYLRIMSLNRWDVTKRTIEWVFSRQETIPEFSFRSETSSDEEFKYFLDTIGNRVTEHLDIESVAASQNFQYTFPHPLNAVVTRLGSTPWLNINNLYSLNSRYVWIKDTKLTCENMNSFLKNWQQTENSKLCCISLRLPFMNDEILFDGLDVIRRNPVNKIEYNHFRNNVLEFGSSFEFKRVDGTIASILMDNGENQEFAMVVWPDLQNRPYPVQEMV